MLSEALAARQCVEEHSQSNRVSSVVSRLLISGDHSTVDATLTRAELLAVIVFKFRPAETC